jgi:hypothetical protein
VFEILIEAIQNKKLQPYRYQMKRLRHFDQLRAREINVTKVFDLLVKAHQQSGD